LIVVLAWASCLVLDIRLKHETRALRSLTKATWPHSMIRKCFQRVVHDSRYYCRAIADSDFQWYSKPDMSPRTLKAVRLVSICCWSSANAPLDTLSDIESGARLIERSKCSNLTSANKLQTILQFHLQSNS